MLLDNLYNGSFLPVFLLCFLPNQPCEANTDDLVDLKTSLRIPFARTVSAEVKHLLV